MKRLLKLPKAYYLVPIAYLTFGAVWILGTDALLAQYGSGLSWVTLAHLVTLKGFAFVGISTLFLFLLARRHVRLLRTSKLSMKSVLRMMNSLRVEHKHHANELDAILNNSLVGIAFVDSHMVFKRVNKSFCQIMNCGCDDFIGKNVLQGGACVLCDNVSEYLLSCQRSGEPVEVEFRAVFPDGKSKWLQVSITKIKAVGKMNGFVVVLRDITARKDNEDQIVYLSHHDFLTELPNRRFFYEKLDDACKIARRYGESFCVLFMDINDFKSYNDRHGHEFGDAILKEFASTVRQGLRESDVLSRLGGDEFAAIVRGVGEREVCLAVADKLRSRLAEKRLIHGVEVCLSASIGIALYPADGDGVDALLNVADKSMYAQKDFLKGRDGKARPSGSSRRDTRKDNGGARPRRTITQ